MIAGFLVQTYTDTIKGKVEKGGKSYGKLYRGQSFKKNVWELRSS